MRKALAFALLTLFLCLPTAAAAEVGLAASTAAQTPSQPPKPAAQDGFVPIDQLAPKEELPAAPLVMAAYIVAWLIPLVYVWSLWRRLHKVEAEIADVAKRITAGPRR